MKKNIITIIALLFTFISCAQTETFDIATYKAPKSWEKTTKQGVVSYSTFNEAKAIFCSISIFASSVSKGTAMEEFNSEWDHLAIKTYDVKDAPEIDTTSDDDGREVIVGSSTFQNNDIAGAIIMYTYVGFGRTTSVLFFCNSVSYQKDIEDFLLKFDLKKTVPKATSTSSTTTTPKTNSGTTTATTTTTTTTTPPFKPSNNLEGAWMKLHTTQYYGDLISGGSPEWISFFKNGRLKQAVPDDPNTYNYNASDLSYYQISSSNTKLKWFADGPWVNIKFKNNNQIEISSETYYRCKPVDGLKLEGTWTSYSNPNDPSLDDGNGAKSMIKFSKNGSFTDYGIFVRILDQTVFDRPPTPAGSGTYSINNFSLTLNYSNGTVRKISFTGLLSTDLFSNNKTIYLQRLGFTKRG